MLGRINVWSNADNPDRWENGDGTETINVNSNFSFNDSDWNNLGDVNSWERYEVDAGAALDVTQLADVAAKKAAGLVEYGSGQSTTAELVRGPGENLGALTDTIASLSVLDSDDNDVSSEINMVRTRKDTWNSVENDESNSNERQEFFVTSEDNYWGEFVGSIEENGGIVIISDNSGNVLSKDITGNGMTFDKVSEQPGFLEIWNELKNALPESVSSYEADLQFYFQDDTNGDERIWLYLNDKMMVEVNIKSSYFTLPTESAFQTFENETINLSDVNGDLIANVSSTFSYTHSSENFSDDDLTYQSTTFTYETLNVSEYEQEYNYFVGDYIDWSDVGSINAYETTEYLENGTEKKSSSFEFMALSESVGSKFLGALEIEGASMILRDATGSILDSNVEIEADAPAVVASISDADAGNTDIATVSINRKHDEDITIDYTISADNNFNTITGEMTISAGKKSGSIDMSVVPENAIDNNESFNVKLSNISMGSISNDTAIITFADDDPNDSTGNQSDFGSDDDPDDFTGNQSDFGSDYFFLEEDKGFTEISDAPSINFIDGTTVLDLGSSLDFADLDISQGEQEYSADTIIKNKSDDNYLAILNDIDFSSITADDFVASDIA